MQICIICFIIPEIDYKESLFFSAVRPSSKTRDTQMATRVTDGARRERHKKGDLFSSRAAALVSRVSRLASRTPLTKSEEK